ncbi:Alg9-like mannosyltransferase [Colletotrichum graminicola]|uniref:Mannosyltransferase n=1 Tax=Colletotrichum graminicola (strain M1.001 / M2 / FGSC 10212) TaxID=645133 RepID=E3Q5R6_COLGM|nr:Alg9-like mannosyltransferase [Colletotrichum graminicola M1.001]EFQ26557.1 Alg9-like mannosyltransferase [Colletotrichum graminicola M1.001]WDK14440.1 Alg9-like mannosyltransferase [Colletotrichum graminicola]
MKLLDVALLGLIPTLITIHLILVPDTKVEESFNIQAAHDVLVYGTPTHDVAARLRATYDHFDFPGAVPRTFIGPVLLAGLGGPVVNLFGFHHAQLIVRALLGFANAAALLVFASSLNKGLGSNVMRWWVMLLVSQFHVVFYASRTLPNMFAFGLTTLAAANLLPFPSTSPKSRSARLRVAISLLVFAAAIFRSEVAVLLATTGLYLLATHQTTILHLVRPFLISFAVAVAVSVPLDSYFWQKPLWPELWGFYYNAILGSSSNWGVSPWHYYFSSALPRLLVNPLAFLLVPLALFHPATSRTAAGLVVPPLLFVAIYSLQPHKEARFIFYAVPPLTAAAAQGANLIFARRSKSPLYALASAALVLSVLASLAASTGMLLLSSLNYPGGDALRQLHALVVSDSSGSGGAVTSVHTDVLSCMTGVTLFNQNLVGLPKNPHARALESALHDGTSASTMTSSPILTFDKTEDKAVLADPAFWSRFDYVLAEDPASVRGGQWETVGIVQGYAGVEILRPGSKSPSDGGDEEEGEPRVLGRGLVVKRVRGLVRGLTGGWWVGPRMEPRIRILKRTKDAGAGVRVVSQ